MTTGPMPAGWKRMRKFLLVRVRDESGRTHKAAQIRCSECGEVAYHRKRGNQDSKVWFERHGWLVGNTEAHDRCGQCIAFKQRKVVKMEDHRKPKDGPALVAKHEPLKQMTREDARIVWRSIEEHWNEAASAYKPGWSDEKIAADLAVPQVWVETVRERDYGGSGDDPGLQMLIDQAGLLQAEMRALDGMMEQAGKTLENYRNSHRILLAKVDRLQAALDAIGTPAQRKAASF